MKRAFHPLSHPLWHVACVAASAVVSVGVLLVVGVAFDSASSQPWLTDSPRARAAVAACDRLSVREQRHVCVRQLALAAQARDRGAAVLAAADAASARVLPR